MMAEERGEATHDSDSFILPDSKLTTTPFSLVPFSRSPTSRAISSVPDTTRSVHPSCPPCMLTTLCSLLFPAGGWTMQAGSMWCLTCL